MRKNLERELAALEHDLGRQLRHLPAVEPSGALRQRVWERPSTDFAGGANQRPRWRQLVGFPRSAMVATALALVLMVGWLGTVWLQSSQMQVLGALLLPAAGAAPGLSGDLSWRLGVETAHSQVDFRLAVDLPTLPRALPAQRLAQPAWSESDVLELASRLGIKGELQRYSEDLVYFPSLISSIDLNRGTFFFEWLREGQPGEQLSREEMEEAAVRWLEQAGLLPRQPYSIESEYYDYGQYWVTLRPTAGPDGLPIVSLQPCYRLLVAADGQIINVQGCWYEPEEEFGLPVSSYLEAFQALQSGAGELVTQGLASYAPAEAEVTAVSLGYQLAYTLNFQPYLIPVAVFAGELTPEGSTTARPFQAYVSLVKQPSGPNAGHFELDTPLPPALAQTARLSERPMNISEGQLPALQAALGNAGEIGATSWDGGWLWRGSWQPAGQPAGPVDEEQAGNIASQLASELRPLLPGDLARAQLIETGMEHIYTFRFDLLYDGLAVEPLGGSAASCLIVQVTREGGTVVMVQCSQPMQPTDELQQLITPEQAWQRLQQNAALVYVDQVGEALPAAAFRVQRSQVTEVTLAHVPRNRHLARNEHYDPKYIFRGIALAGEREVSFTAVVDAAPDK
jgi:hypothetical protein